MNNPSNSGADGAYERALAAFNEKSYEVARRWVLEALAHNRQHAGARALLARLDAARQPASPFKPAASGPEAISTDPTVLISRATRPAASEPIEPTVMITRDDPWRGTEDTDARPGPPPRRPSAPAAADPTVIAQRKQRSPSAGSTFSVGTAVQALGERFRGREARPRQPSTGRAASTGGRRSRSWTSDSRGALIAVAAVAVGALLVWGAYRTVRWLWPAGQLLTITKPVGGTIFGPGIECGSRGSECSTKVATGEAVELRAENDKGYVWSGYTGDCAPTGRIAMTQARTCGATFDKVETETKVVTFTLTIRKPEGGTVIGNGGIFCGTMGSVCTAEIPRDVPVTLKGNAADGFTWEQFNGDCPATGEMMMTSAKTCGAVFVPTVGGTLANKGPIRVPAPGTGSGGSFTPKRPPTTTSVLVAVPPPPPPGAGGGTGTTPDGPIPTTTSIIPTPDDKAKRPKTDEEHAKEEIQLLVKNYCAALGSLKPEVIRTLFHQVNERELKDKLREYKSLKCTISSPPEYDRLDPIAAGAAQIKFGMKQMVEMRSGGAPQVVETIVTMVLSRKDLRTPWLIDRLSHEAKPKS